ncbi:DUF2798 domain-containing protein [Glaciimonas soli]|nr:DUF2798 domain-containing protein [Glaciimonas soli]
MSILMSGVISFIIISYEEGFSNGFFMKFLGAWKFSFPFSFVVAQFVTPLVRKFTMLIVKTG